MTPPSTSYRSVAIVSIKAIVGFGVLAIIIRQIGWQNITSLLAKADLRLFAQACVWLTLGLAAQALRWNEVMRALDAQMGSRTALIGTFESMFFSQILPSSIGGDIFRALRAFDAGATAGKSILGVLIDRAFGLWFVAAIVLVAYVAGGTALAGSAAFNALSAIAAVVCAGAITAVILGAYVEKGMLPRWAGGAVSLVREFSTIVRAVTPPLQIVATMALSTYLIGLGLQTCGRSIGLALSLWDTLIVLQGMMLASVIPLSIGGWGWREGAAVLLLAALNVGAAEATILSVLFGLGLTIIGLGGAVVWMLAGYKRFERGDGLQQLRQGAGSNKEEKF